MKLVTFLKTTLAVVLLVTSSAQAALLITFNPSTTNVSVGDTFTVDVLATTENSLTDGFLGFDLGFSFANVSLDSAVVGSSFTQGATPFNDVAGFAALPTPVSGAELLLATLTFTAVSAGTTSIDVNAAQFAAANPPGFTWSMTNIANVDVKAAAVTAPATLSLFALAGLITLVRRKR